MASNADWGFSDPRGSASGDPVYGDGASLYELGRPLHVPLDTHTAVHYAGYANEATRARLEPHWQAVLEEVLESGAG